MNRILIIGSEGFIGRSCVQFFLDLSLDVHGADLLDLKNPKYVYHKVSRFDPGFDSLFRTHQFDVCINAAGSGSVPSSMEYPYNDFEANTIDTFRVLESIRQFNPTCKYINISSAAVYGNPVELPVRESSAIKPLSPYGWHKYYSELICQEFFSLHGIRTCSVRPFSVYGPGLKKQLFWDIYQKVIKADTHIQLFGSGNESRDFIFIDDLVQCLHLILQAGKFGGEVYNIATGKEITIKEAAGFFVGCLNPSMRIEFSHKSRSGDPNNWQADISSIIALGFVEGVNLEDGLRLYAEWVTESQSRII